MTSGFPSQRNCNVDFGAFVVRINTLWDKQSSYRWFELSQRSFNITIMIAKTGTPVRQPVWDEFSYDSLRWHYNGPDSVSNDQPHGCLLNYLLRRGSKKTSKLPVTSLCAGNSPGTGEFPAQRASNAENVSIWWRHHVLINKSRSCCHDCTSVNMLRLEHNGDHRTGDIGKCISLNELVLFRFKFHGSFLRKVQLTKNTNDPCNGLVPTRRQVIFTRSNTLPGLWRQLANGINEIHKQSL